jgi:hypothetical protein
VGGRPSKDPPPWPVGWMLFGASCSTAVIGLICLARNQKLQGSFLTVAAAFESVSEAGLLPALPSEAAGFYCRRWTGRCQCAQTTGQGGRPEQVWNYPTTGQGNRDHRSRSVGPANRAWNGLVFPCQRSPRPKNEALSLAANWPDGIFQPPPQIVHAYCASLE